MTPEDEFPRSEGVQYATGEEQRTAARGSREEEAAGSKQERHSVVDVSGDESRTVLHRNLECQLHGSRSTGHG